MSEPIGRVTTIPEYIALVPILMASIEAMKASQDILYTEEHGSGWDDIEGQQWHHHKKRERKVSEMAEEWWCDTQNTILKDVRRNGGYYVHQSDNTPLTKQMLIEHLQESSEEISISVWETKEAYEEYKAEQERMRLERAAAAFAKLHKVEPGTMALIEALDRELNDVKSRSEQWNSGECRAERHAACLYAGNRDAFFQDNDYVNSQFSKERRELEDIRTWLMGNCPLLWAKYEEKKLVGKEG